MFQSVVRLCFGCGGVISITFGRHPKIIFVLQCSSLGTQYTINFTRFGYGLPNFVFWKHLVCSAWGVHIPVQSGTVCFVLVAAHQKIVSGTPFSNWLPGRMFFLIVIYLLSLYLSFSISLSISPQNIQFLDSSSLWYPQYLSLNDNVLTPIPPYPFLYLCPPLSIFKYPINPYFPLSLTLYFYLSPLYLSIYIYIYPLISYFPLSLSLLITYLPHPIYSSGKFCNWGPYVEVGKSKRRKFNRLSPSIVPSRSSTILIIW